MKGDAIETASDLSAFLRLAADVRLVSKQDDLSKQDVGLHETIMLC